MENRILFKEAIENGYDKDSVDIHIKFLNGKIAELTKSIDIKDSEIDNLSKDVAHYKTEVSIRDTSIRELRGTIDNLNKEGYGLSNLKRRIDELESSSSNISELHKKMDELLEKIK